MTQTEDILHAHVPEESAGRRLDQALAELFPDYSRTRLSAWIKSGDVLLDGGAVVPRHVVSGGELVTVRAQPNQEVALAPEAIGLDVRFEDRDVLVVNKPVGLVV